MRTRQNWWRREACLRKMQKIATDGNLGSGNDRRRGIIRQLFSRYHFTRRTTSNRLLVLIEAMTTDVIKRTGVILVGMLLSMRRMDILRYLFITTQSINELKWQEVGQNCILRSFITCTLLQLEWSSQGG
jgi:hypothetical protein